MANPFANAHSEANARLIAAAPDLLETARWALAQMSDMQEANPSILTDADRDTIDALRAAIAKATSCS